MKKSNIKWRKCHRTVKSTLYIWRKRIDMALVAATLPLVLAISKSMNVDFLVLALPLTLGASCAFMFPMATPPNAIVFSSGKIKIEKMARYGLMVNALAFVIITFFSYYLGGLLL